MLTYSNTNGFTVSMGNGKKSLLAFPSDAKEKGDIILLSVPEGEVKEGVISWPGEYDIDGVSIRGIGHDEGQKVSYAVGMEGIRTAFLASPLHEWTDYELEQLGDIDILVIPAEDSKLVQKLIDEIDPRILIPLKSKNADVFAEVLKAVGAQGKEAEKEYKLKGGLPTEGREVIVLK